MSKKAFRELTFGARFTFRGRTFTKVALNLAEDENRHGHVFMYEMEVEPIEGEAEGGKLDSDKVR